MDTTITPARLLICSTLSAAGISRDEKPGAVDAILRKVMHDEPIPPDYAREVLRCIDVLQDTVEALDGPALGLKI